MKPPATLVPAPLLLDPNLTESAKLIWIICQRAARIQPKPISPSTLRERSGFAPHTIRRGLAQLKATGWLNTHSVPTHTTICMPDDLLLDNRLKIQPKLLYGILQLTPAFAHPKGEFRYAELSRMTGLGLNTIKRALQALRKTGWLRVSQANQLRPIRFTLLNPAEERRQLAVMQAEQRLTEASFLGEAIMREYLSLLIDSDEYQDNASPGFLINPFTDEKLQYDRYYPPNVAFEYNGPQHDGPTERYPAAWKQQGRDYIKLGISVTRGITLITLHAEDLSLRRLQDQIAGLLPLRSLDGHQPLIAYLESVSRRYRRKQQSNRKSCPPGATQRGPS